jgi:hypothetical protein
MKRYWVLEVVSGLLKVGGLILCVIMLLMLGIAEPNERVPLVIYALVSGLGGWSLGEYLELQMDNAKHNQRTSQALILLLDRKKKKKEVVTTHVVTPVIDGGKSTLAALRRMKV